MQYPASPLESQSKFLFACSFCEKTEPKMKRCSRCRTKYYCSKECITKDWIKHKPFCNRVTENRVIPFNEKESRYCRSMVQKYSKDLIQSCWINYFGSDQTKGMALLTQKDIDDYNLSSQLKKGKSPVDPIHTVYVTEEAVDCLSEFERIGREDVKNIIRKCDPPRVFAVGFWIKPGDGAFYFTVIGFNETTETRALTDEMLEKIKEINLNETKE